ncbi:Small RNA 2'-O-methyltransferase [Chytridiales sp. JEL 0842]|nr:Small RNA 2'-O-methyltransferase [Chytridiales sp. JEL 0842]
MVVTTPNAEFNLNFPNLKYGTPKSVFRHYDHRFEWTRSEFHNWANAQAANFGYSVSFSGVGLLPNPVRDDVGHCTQIATFIRNEIPRDPLPHLTEPLILYEIITYPYFEKDNFTDQEIIDEVAKTLSDALFDHISTQYPFLETNTEPLEDFMRHRWADQRKSFEIEIGSLWSLLPIRQLCKKQKRLLEALKSDCAKDLVQLVGDERVRIVCEIEFPTERFEPPAQEEEVVEESNSASDDEYFTQEDEK